MSDQPPTSAPDPQDDDALMEAIASGDESALRRLMERWQGPIYRFIRRTVRDEDMAEDLTQETFWRLWRGRQGYLAGGRFSTWLFRIAARLCLDHFRHGRRRPREVGDAALPAAMAPPRDAADLNARLGELHGALQVALDRLPANQRAALMLHRFEGMSYKEIAASLDCSLGAVEQLIYRARRRLREDLQEFLE